MCGVGGTTEASGETARERAKEAVRDERVDSKGPRHQEGFAEPCKDAIIGPVTLRRPQPLFPALAGCRRLLSVAGAAEPRRAGNTQGGRCAGSAQGVTSRVYMHAAAAARALPAMQQRIKRYSPRKQCNGSRGFHLALPALLPPLLLPPFVPRRFISSVSLYAAHSLKGKVAGLMAARRQRDSARETVRRAGSTPGACLNAQ